MPSKISLFNKEVILQIGRSTGWLSIIYFLGLLFSLPLRMIMIVSDKNNMNYEKVDNLFQYDFPIQVVLMVTIPILMAVFLFRYLHVKQSADLMHSLPLKRVRIYHHYALSGVVFLVVPVVIVASVILFLHSVHDLNPYFETKDIFYWIGITILVNLLLFTAGIFVAMMTGISAVHAVLSYIFLLFPVGMVVLLFFNLKILLYGFPSDYYLNRDLERMSPITYFSVLERRPFHWEDAVLYVILTILLYGLGLFFYKKRKLEAASEAIAFSKLRLVFKFGITFCMMLAGGMYFSDFSYNSLGWTIFGYAIGTIIGYIVAEMVLQKTWRIFIHFKGLAIYSSIIVLLVMAIQALGIYENKVPEQDKIKNVLLTDNPSIFLDQNKMYEHYYIPKSLKERNNIEAVRKLHKQIIADKKINQKGKNDQFRVAFLMYEMKDGKKVIREYRLNNLLYEDLYKPIYESAEYKRGSKEIFRLKENKIESINIRANGPVNKVVTISEPNDVKKAITILKADVLDESYEDSVYYENIGSTIEINFGKNRTLPMELKPSYYKLNEWLKEKKWFERSTISADNITYALVVKNNFGDLENREPSVKEIKKQPGVLKVTDKLQIQQSLEQAGARTGSYVIVFYFKDVNYTEFLYFDDEHAPEFIKEHFK